MQKNINGIVNTLKMKYLGSGEYSDCYLNEETNEVYKKYKEGNLYNCIPYIKKMVGEEENCFIFPSRLDEENGYYMQYVEGFILKHILNMVNVDSYLKMLVNTQKSLENLSKKNILVNDTHFGNVIINNNNLIHIDTDFYIKNPLYHNICNNYRNYNIELANGLLRYGVNEDFIKYSIDGKDISTYFNLATIDGEISPIELLEVLREYYQQVVGYNITYLSDYLLVSDMHENVIGLR